MPRAALPCRQAVCQLSCISPPASAFALPCLASPCRRSFLTINCNSKASSEVHLLPADLSARSEQHSSSIGAGGSGWAATRVVQPRLPGLEYFVEHNGGQLYILSNARGADNYAVYR